MTNGKPFPLAGLLRLRKIQEDQAAAALNSARGRAELIRERNRRLRETLESHRADAGSMDHIVAIAAARASASSMLLELDALGRSTADEEARMLADHQESRRRALTLEKLEAGHQAAQDQERGVEEQRALDELAVRGWTASTGVPSIDRTGTLRRGSGQAES
jgi:flagellar protein FliJ